MKVKIKAITPLGIFESDLRDILPSEVEKARLGYEQLYRLNVATIQQGGKTIYIPAEVIQRSVVILETLDE